MTLAARESLAYPETLPTRLVPDLLDRFQKVDYLQVFDTGFAVPETIEHFVSRKCRLHFNAAYELLQKPPVATSSKRDGRLIDKKAQDQALYQTWRQRFDQAMNFPDNTRFDLCLFWDFFNYMDDIALKAFSDSLSPYLKDTTVGHAYVLLKEGHSVLNRSFGIAAKDEVVVRPAHWPDLPAFARPQARVTSMLQDFRVNHSVLRRDGLLEISLKAQLANATP